MPIIVKKSFNGVAIHRFVSTDALERLKQSARKVKRAQNIPHHEALEEVAKRIHFDNWHQVVAAHAAMLPTETAIRNGVVFAMDIKDACDFEVDLPSEKGRLIADDMLSAFLYDFILKLESEATDEDGQRYRENWSEAELKESANETIDSLVFFRYEGNDPPTDVLSVVNLVAEACFFGPDMIWIKGQFYDTFSLPDDSQRGYVRF